MASLYVKAVPTADLNRNTEWFTYPGVWTTYILILFFSWLVVLSVFGCTPGMAWTIVNLAHFAVTYHFFHWKKGTPFSEDQGIYNRLTWWEQVDNGKQLTRNRKFLTVVPIVLYLIASHTTDYQHPMLFLNTLAVLILVVAKFPHMHKVRIFGINGDHNGPSEDHALLGLSFMLYGLMMLLLEVIERGGEDGHRRRQGPSSLPATATATATHAMPLHLSSGKENDTR
ncbi:hypothetical protein V2J09_024343 [Rumex salicifolius]